MTEDNAPGLASYPPADIAQRHIEAKHLDAATLQRIAWPGREVEFGKQIKYRFDDPLGEFGTLYCAEDFMACLAETVIRKNFSRMLKDGKRGIPRKNADGRLLVTLSASKPLHLALLRGEGLLAIGGYDLNAGDDYGATQAWSKAIHDHFPQFDGLYVTSRFVNDLPSAVLFERCRARAALDVGAAEDLIKSDSFNRFIDGYQIALV